MNFVIVGGGLIGVEFFGVFVEMKWKVFLKDYLDFDFLDMKIIFIESGFVVLGVMLLEL